MDKEKRPYPERTRERIDSTLILGKLMQHVKGEVELSNTQIQAARILLAKTLPDLSAVEHSGEIGSKTEQEMTRDELLRIASDGRTGTTAAARRAKQPSLVH